MSSQLAIQPIDAAAPALSEPVVIGNVVSLTEVSVTEAAPKPRARNLHLVRQRLVAREFSWSDFAYRTVKRFLDIVFSLGLLIILAPVMVLVAFVVRCSSSGPSIYCQRRLTDGGKVFTLFKFRSMRSDAEVGSGAVWAGENDPRITPIGRFLRRSRLDELPQLLNVLIGDMSFVGPRPERPELATDLAREFPSFYRRLEVRAGLTGLAQVAGGYAGCMTSYRKKLALDRLYVQNRSVYLDCRIILQTVIVVLTGEGAR